nr:MAG TPA: hypothetical protein [Caudoviricetes sp.]
MWRVRVVRAQPCEHARNTHPPCVFWVRLLNVVCAFHYNAVSVASTTRCSLLTITMFTIEH